METKQTIFSDDIVEASNVLAENMLHSEAIMIFNKAKKRVEEDQEALSLLQKIAQIQADLRKRQTRNEISEEDLNHLRILQNQIQSNQAIQEADRAQQDAVQFVRDINQEISNLIGFDFGSLARRPGCC